MCGAEKIHVHSGGEKITAGRERLLAVSSEMRQISILRVAEEVGEPEYLTKESTRWAEVLEELGLAFEGVPGEWSGGPTVVCTASTARGEGHGGCTDVGPKPPGGATPGIPIGCQGY